MGRELGRISGPLLSDNLLRNGNNLAFETQLLYFDVVNNRIRINTTNTSTTDDLFVNSTTNTNNLIVTTLANLGANMTLSANQIQNPISSITIQPNQSSNPSITTPGLSTSNLYLYSNTVSSTSGAINFTANGSGAINLGNTNGNVQVTVNGSLHATGDITFDGNIQLGNETTDTISFAADVGSDILPSATLTDNLGQLSLTWKNIYINDVFTSTITLPDFNISGNNITGTVTDGTVIYTANGTGSVNVEYLNFANNNITNVWPSASTDAQKSVIFAPNGSGNLQVNSTTSLILPIGNDTTRVLSANGELRYNNLNNNVEGYSNTGYVNFYNVYSQNHLTYVTAELTPNVADNTLRFGINGTVTTAITSSALTTNKLVGGNVAITTNTIKNSTTNGNITFTANGSGLIKLDNALTLSNSATFNNTTGNPFQFNSVGYGHFTFAGTGGVVMPVSSENTTPVQGDIRYNSTIGTGEVYSNIYGWMAWVGATNSTISETDDQDLSVIYTLMLGY